MEKIIGKDFLWNEQSKMLIERCSLKLPLLYKSLVAVYGEEKAEEVYDRVYEANFKSRLGKLQGMDLGDIMRLEVQMFPAIGWKIWIEEKEEENGTSWYEHLGHCPHLEATKKHKLPIPCSIVCDMDCKYGEKYKIGKWERLKHMPSGDNECCFKIKKAE